MITLGINAAFHDSAAAIVVDGEVLAASEEERFTRIKHAKRPLPFTAWELPFHAIDDCLARLGIGLGEVDQVAYSYNPQRFIQGRLDGQDKVVLPLEPSAHPPGGGWTQAWDPLFACYIVNAPRQLIDAVPHHLRKRWQGARLGQLPWHFIDHHLCHQASAFLAARFDNCAVMTLDGRGEDATTCYGVYADNLYRPLGEVHMPHSLGLLYERITSHLGFLHSSDEYKVMALAALGQPRYKAQLQEVVRVGPSGLYEVADFDIGQLAGPPRQQGEPLAQHHLDLAASLQDVLEDTVLQLAWWLREASGERCLAMAGGVALNCVMNARLRDSGVFDEVWVQPAAGDAGTALGAALWVDSRQRVAGKPAAEARRVAGTPLAERSWWMSHAYLGPGYEDEAIETLLRWAKVPYRRLDDVAQDVARLLSRDLIIAWFQGRMEFGPRALGNRSILASPIHAGMQARLNELKDREDFRPVAPAINEEDLPGWFAPAQANGGESPFMLFVYDVLPHRAALMPAACHSDGTARVQTVSHDTNPRFHALLKAFGHLTGVPVLINTSFNVRGQPIVCSPQQALEAFFSTPIDALVIGAFLVEKRPAETRP